MFLLYEREVGGGVDGVVKMRLSPDATFASPGCRGWNRGRLTEPKNVLGGLAEPRKMTQRRSQQNTTLRYLVSYLSSEEVVGQLTGTRA